MKVLHRYTPYSKIDHSLLTTTSFVLLAFFGYVNLQVKGTHKRKHRIPAPSILVPSVIHSFQPYENALNDNMILTVTQNSRFCSDSTF